jgi:hypothetical protein
MANERKSLKDTQTAGAVKIVSASSLAAAGITGLVASGILEKMEPNKFYPEKSDYFVRGDDGTLYILNETATLKAQLGQPGVLGMKIEVIYLGKKEPKKKGDKAYHDFECFTVAS